MNANLDMLQFKIGNMQKPNYGNNVLFELLIDLQYFPMLLP